MEKNYILGRGCGLKTPYRLIRKSSTNRIIMKKEGVKLSEIREDILSMDAITSTSKFERRIDSKIETLSRVLKKSISDTIGDHIDAISAKRKKIIESAQKEVIGKPNSLQELQRVLRRDKYLPDMADEERLLWDTKIDLEYIPIYVSDDSVEYAYDRLPEEESTLNESGQSVEYKGEEVEFRGNVFYIKRLRKKLRDLIDKEYLIIGEEPVRATSPSGKIKK